MLFVGRPDGSAISAREMAAVMRDVSPREVEEVVAELQVIYRQGNAPYEVAVTAEGYRLQLREEFGRIRAKFFGRSRETRLSPAAMAVLSIIAYEQPVSIQAIDEQRGAASARHVALLVRRGLVRLERPPGSTEPPRCVTTQEFLKLFRLANIEELPQLADLDAA
jgi:segregation and condensation protein B